MQTLIIYDSTGAIYYQASGAVTEPTGIPFLWVDVPEGKYVKSVDVSGVTPTAVFEDFFNEAFQEHNDSNSNLKNNQNKTGGLKKWLKNICRLTTTVR